MSDPFNPYTEKLEQDRTNFASNAVDYDAALRDLQWYVGFDPQAANVRYNTIQREQRDAIDALNSKREQVDRQDAEIRRLERVVPPVWHFLESALRTVTLAELAAAKACRDALQADLTALSARAPDLAESRELEILLTRYRQFDPLQAEAKCRQIPPVQAMLEASIADLSEKHARIEAVLEPNRVALAKLERDELRLVAERGKADVLARKMDALQHDAGGRREVHQECEERFQVRNPSQAVAARDRQLEAVRRQMKKLREEMVKQAQRAQHDVRAVVIDGSNLCYVGGQKEADKFIGLRALDVLVPEMAIRYEKVILYFDYGERRRLNLTEKALQARFARWTPRVYVTKRGQAADEGILSSAKDDKHAYVISGDRYREFKPRFGFIDERRLAAMVTHDQLQLHDLDLVLPLAPEAQTGNNG